MASTAQPVRSSAAASGGAAIFRDLALPARRHRPARHRLHRQTRHFLDRHYRPSRSLTKASASGARTARNFRRASPPASCWPIFIFPVRYLGFFARPRQGAPNPALYAALLAAIHLLLFAALVRLFSARTNRDYAFLAVLAVTAMLASAILTVETGFLSRSRFFWSWRSRHSSRWIFAAVPRRRLASV